MFSHSVAPPRFFQTSKKIRALVSGKKCAAVFGWLPLVAAAWILAKACALALSSPALPAAPFALSVASGPDRESGPGLPPFAHFATLESNNLFNLKSHAPAHAAPAPPPPGLKAFLMGTVEAPLPENARAVIQHEGTQHVLRPGQGIAGFTLKDIRRGSVVFESQGRIVELKTVGSGDLPGQEAGAAAATAKQTPAPQAQETPEAQPLPERQIDGSVSQNQETPEAQAPVGLQGNAPVTENRPEPSGPSVPLAAASLAVPEMGRMIQQGILAPNEDNSGLVVRQSPNNPILKAMKLKKGDVITSVNGQPAAIMADSHTMMRELESGSLHVALLRDGRMESVILRISGRNAKQR